MTSQLLWLCLLIYVSAVWGWNEMEHTILVLELPMRQLEPKVTHGFRSQSYLDFMLISLDLV